MALYNTKFSYGSMAKALHWLVAVAILTMLAVGFYMTGLPVSPSKFTVYGLHKSLGISILALVVVRLLWKSINVSPLLPDVLNAYEKFLAKAGHALLYVLAIAMPLSGWGMTSAAGFPVSVFGWFTLPDLVAPDKELKNLLRDVHYYTAWALIIMISLHVLAALLHHFYYKDNVLRRMLPFTK